MTSNLAAGAEADLKPGRAAGNLQLAFSDRAGGSVG